MTLLDGLLRQLSDAVSFIVDRFQLVCGTLFDCNFWVVRTLLGALTFVFRTAVSLLLTLLAGLNQGLEDFKGFLWDLLDLAAALPGRVDALLRTVGDCVQWTVTLLVSCVQWLTSVAAWLHACALTLAQLVGRAVALLWAGILAGLGLPPRLLVILGSALVDTLTRGDQALRRGARKLLLGFCSAPLDAYVGLVLLVLTWYLFKRFSLHRRIQGAVVKAPALIKRLGLLLTSRLAAGSETDEAPQNRDEPAGEPSAVRELRSAVKARPGMKRTRKQVAEEEPEDEDAVLRLRKQVEQLQDLNLCVVCQEGSRSVTLLPCRHLCLCQPCSSRILTAKPVCPMCRKYVEDVLQVYT